MPGKQPRSSRKRIPQRQVIEPPKHFFERQPEEPPRAWEGFCTYRDMGAQRSNRKTATKLGINSSQVDEWGMRYRWKERIALWQKHEDEVFEDARHEHLREMAKRHAAIAVKMHTMIWERLKTMTAAELGPKEISQWAKAAADLERVSMGAPNGHMVVSSAQPIALQNNVTVKMSQDERIKEIERLAKRREVCGYD